MIIQYALIRDSIVADRTFTADPGFIDAIRPLWDHIEPLDTEQEQSVGIGWTWTGSGFLPPDVPAPEIRPEIKIVSVTADAAHQQDFSFDTLADGSIDVTCREGALLTVTANLELDARALAAMGVTLAQFRASVTETFRMPLRARGSGRIVVLQADIVAGVVTIVCPMSESEIWEVTEASINEALPREEQMSFSGLEIFVLAAGTVE